MNVHCIIKLHPKSWTLALYVLLPLFLPYVMDLGGPSAPLKRQLVPVWCNFAVEPFRFAITYMYVYMRGMASSWFCAHVKMSFMTPIKGGSTAWIYKELNHSQYLSG
ncbi:hypothetical protein V6N12_062080 [Hibiscus sabdariffa]|uniref:Uncharacterized protein n=1 Tax=Hibiscus sabdariffa TaxID=183260 RepID=A0ABR2F7T1_9ROSI